MRVKKLINNNILCVVDNSGRELIVTGKGLGFNRKVGEIIDDSLVEKKYVMENETEQRKLNELLSEISLEELELTNKLLDFIKKEINQTLNESLLITLADHVSFAIRRKNEGLEYSNPLANTIMEYYTVEYQVGMKCLSIIEKETGVRLNDAEASFIALHIINAELNTKMSEIYGIADLIDDCVALVEDYYDKKYDRESMGFSRFIIHLRYFSQRIVIKKMLDETNDKDKEFHRIICESYPEHYECAKQIERFVNAKYKVELNQEELSYLTIHLKRINDSR